MINFDVFSIPEHDGNYFYALFGTVCLCSRSGVYDQPVTYAREAPEAVGIISMGWLLPRRRVGRNRSRYTGTLIPRTRPKTLIRTIF